MKKITIINCHPNSASLCFGLVEAYKKGAIAAGADVKEIVVADLKFSVNLAYGYQKRTDLEPDLVEAWDKITWADHLVWVYPVWWGGLPAIAKGFIDRVFLPGYAFRPRENSVFWDKLLIGKTARIITTLDQPGWYYRLMFGRPSTNQLKKAVLEFCGVKPVRITYIGIVKGSTSEVRAKWIANIERLGRSMS